MKELINFFKKHYVFILITLLTILGFVLRIKIGLPQLASDEVATVVTASQPTFAKILDALLTKNFHAPLFYFILHFWIDLFGESTFSLRLLPILLGTACIPISYFCGKELVSKKAGIFAAAIVSVNFFLISYSHFCKFYALLQLLGFLSVYFLTKFEKSEKIKFLYLLALVNAAIVYTYVLGFLFVFIQFVIYFGYRFFVKKNIDLKPVIHYAGALFVLSLPVIPFIAKVIINTQNSAFPGFWWYKFNLNHIPTVVLSWFSPALPYVYKEYAGTDATQAFYGLDILPIILFNIFPLLIVSIAIAKTILKKDFTTCLFVIAVLFILAELFGAVTGKFAFCSRFTTVCFPAIVLAAACGLAQIESMRIFPKLLVVLYVLLNLLYLQFDLPSSFNTGVSDVFSLAETLNRYELKENDYLIMPFRGYYLQKYYDTSKVNFISYDINYSYKTNDEAVLGKIYDKEDLNLEKGTTFYEKYRRYLEAKEPSKALSNHLQKDCLDKLKPKSRVILVVYLRYNTDDYDFIMKNYRKDNFKLLSVKLNHDIETLLESSLSSPQIYAEKNYIIKEYKK